jgi:hypothetical protein
MNELNNIGYVFFSYTRYDAMAIGAGAEVCLKHVAESAKFIDGIDRCFVVIQGALHHLEQQYNKVRILLSRFFLLSSLFC